MHTPLAPQPTCHFEALLNLLHKALEYAQGEYGVTEGAISHKLVGVLVPVSNLLLSCPPCFHTADTGQSDTEGGL